jgi:ligand-binding sensor domain-containing protein
VFVIGPLLLVAALAGRNAAAGELTVRKADPIQFALKFEPSGTAISVKSIGADSAGFLWAATTTGIYRFDGSHFHAVTSELASHIAVTADGWVWAGGDRGLTAFRRGERRQLMSTPVTGLVARGNEVAAVAGSVFLGTIASLTDLHVKANGGLTLDRKQRVWFGCGEAACAIDSQGAIERWDGSRGVPPAAWSGAVADEAGGVWTWRPGDLSVARKLTSMRRTALESQLTGSPGFADSTGRIWLDIDWVTENQVYFTNTTRITGLFDPVFAEDQGHRLWLGTSRFPLLLLSSRTWVQTWRYEMSPMEMAMRTSAGRLIAGSDSGFRSYNEAADTWSAWSTQLNRGRAFDFLETSDGFWVIVEHAGILRLDREGRKTGAVFEGSFRGIDFRRLFRDRSGRIWVGAKDGLFILNESAVRLERVPFVPGALSTFAFTTAPDGQEWMGSTAGIARLDGAEWKIVVPAAELLYGSRIGSLAVGPGPELWVAYRREGAFSRVTRQNGRWKRTDFTPEAGFGPGSTRSVLRDRRGWIWRGASEGLFVSDGIHTNAGDWVMLGQAQGLIGSNISTFGFFEDRDGSIWAATNQGMAHVAPDPRWFDPITTSPPRVTALRWNGNDSLWPTTRQILPAAATNLEIDFAQWPDAVPRLPQVRFRLWPLEKEWRTEPANTATYASLPTGAYRFDMRGDRSESIQSFELQIAPSAAIAPWAWWLGGAGIGVAGWWGWRRNRAVNAGDEYWKAKIEFLAKKQDDPEAESKSGSVVAERYRLAECIGVGGFSEVYRASDLRSGGTVAIKQLRVPGEMHSWQRARFEKEIAALARIDHPGVVKLLDNGYTESHQPFLVMPLIEGVSLREYLASGPLSRRLAASWILQIGEALGAAHSQDVLHRDLKPENILIHGDSERIVIVDFGAATIRDAAAGGQSSLMLGSFDYLAPEQVQGRSSPATDVYSFAAVVFEMLTGVRYRGLADGSEEGLGRALPAFSAGFIRELARGIAFIPSERPQEIQAYASALAAYLSSQQATQ